MKVSLQINLAPSDYLHARFMLKHQLDILSDQVDEILLTVDTNPSKGRFADGWHENKENLYQFFQNEIKPNYKVRILDVDYSKPINKKIANFFFDSDHIPAKDFRGGPFYAYFFGLFYATHHYVLHLDSDIFLGGASQIWIKEAIALFNTDAKNFTISPLPGPPHPDDKLIGQSYYEKIAPYTYCFKGMSTRIFMVNKLSFVKHKITLAKPSLRSQIKAIVEGNSNADLPEHLIDHYMHKHGLKRIDFLGSGNGLWSLHPPFRTPAFYTNLPLFIQKVNDNDFPLNQRGFYDMIDEVCDWTLPRTAIAKNRWWKRLLK